jgi:hypothetical protein
MSGSRADKKRELYEGGHPNDEAKAIHRRFIAGPIPKLLPVAAVLETKGRVSGKTIRVPLAIVPCRGHRYLVSMLGEKVNWVRNVRAAGGDVMILRGRWRPAHLGEVPVGERAPIIKRYLLFAVSARPHIPIKWWAPVSEFEAIADDYPVFKVTWQ